MARKKAETEFQDMMGRYHNFRHKYGDRRYCMVCKTLQPKSELKPDYAAAPVFTWVECKEAFEKGKNAGRWSWKEIYEGGESENQRNWLIENGGWLFLLVGKGRVSSDKNKSSRSAYLIPFKTWIDKIEPDLLLHKMGSIGHNGMRGGKPGATALLADWRLDWVDGGWSIPEQHDWWYALEKRLIAELRRVRTMI